MEKTAYITLVPLAEEIQGKRVVLRPYRPEDAQDLNSAVAESRDHLRSWLPFADLHQTIDETRDWINRQAAARIKRDMIGYSIREAAGDRFLGGLGLTPHNWDIRYFEIGYWLRKSAEGKGFMAEAVGLIVDYALADLGANRLEIRCDERNSRSAEVARRLGFRQEALLRNDSQAPDGGLRNTLIFGLVPGDTGR